MAGNVRSEHPNTTRIRAATDGLAHAQLDALIALARERSAESGTPGPVVIRVDYWGRDVGRIELSPDGLNVSVYVAPAR